MNFQKSFLLGDIMGGEGREEGEAVATPLLATINVSDNQVHIFLFLAMISNDMTLAQGLLLTFCIYNDWLYCRTQRAPTLLLLFSFLLFLFLFMTIFLVL